MARTTRSKRNDRGRDSLSFRTLGDESGVGGGGQPAAALPIPTIFLQTDMSKTGSEWFFVL